MSDTRGSDVQPHHHEYVGGRCIHCGFTSTAPDAYVPNRARSSSPARLDHPANRTRDVDRAPLAARTEIYESHRQRRMTVVNGHRGYVEVIADSYIELVTSDTARMTIPWLAVETATQVMP